MTTVMVSGCFDILHAGHLRFLWDAREQGDRLIVCLASDESVQRHKGREPALPFEHRAQLLYQLGCVDMVCKANSTETLGLDFESQLLFDKIDKLVVTEDDRYEQEKRQLCVDTATEYVVLAKTPPVRQCEPISSTEIRRRVMGLDKVPVRVDFAGGWLDVPRLAIPGAYIVNCAVTPFMQSDGSPYEPGGGIGGSAAMAILKGQNGVATELKNGAGWQDAAVIAETGLCVWESGERPKLMNRNSGEWLKGLMAIKWMGGKHDTPALAGRARNYNAIRDAAQMAAKAVERASLGRLAWGINNTYHAQVDEGMDFLDEPDTVVAHKYLGAGHGGYALLLFAEYAEREAYVGQHHGEAMAIEPHCRWANG
jgi:cytidyltransferase-like protein